MPYARWIVGVSLCLGGLSPAAAEPSARPAGDRAEYRTLLSDGRKKLGARDYAGAAAAFKLAVAAKPGDAVALAELSGALLLANDLTGAEQVAQDAVLIGDNKTRAATFYNLGRAQEAQGKLADAQRAYELSLLLRPNHAETQARLKSVGDVISSPHKLAGPFAAPIDFCKAQHLGDDRCSVATDHIADEAGGEDVHLKPPFQAASKVETTSSAQQQFAIANLALQVGGKWYVLTGLGEAGGGHGGSHQIVVRNVGARLVVDWSNSVGRFGHTDEASISVCGVAADGQPRCAGPILTSRLTVHDYCGKDANCTRKSTTDIDFRCRATLRDDTLEVVDDPSKFKNDETGETLPPRLGACARLPGAGTHKLTF